jgi:hypothetical protein
MEMIIRKRGKDDICVWRGKSRGDGERRDEEASDRRGRSTLIGFCCLLANQTTLDPRSRKAFIPQLRHQLIDTLNLNGTELSRRHRRPININKVLPTLPPPTRFGGSLTVMVSSRGARSTPRSAGVNFSIGLFFAFMMLGNDAYLGSLNF